MNNTDKIIYEACLGRSLSSTSASDIATTMLQFLTEEEKQKVIKICGIIPADEELLAEHQKNPKKNYTMKKLEGAENEIEDYKKRAIEVYKAVDPETPYLMESTSETISIIDWREKGKLDPVKMAILVFDWGDDFVTRFHEVWFPSEMLNWDLTQSIRDKISVKEVFGKDKNYRLFVAIKENKNA